MRDSDPLLAVEDPAVVLLFDTVLSPPKENSLANDGENSILESCSLGANEGVSVTSTSCVDELGVFGFILDGPVFVRALTSIL